MKKLLLSAIAVICAATAVSARQLTFYNGDQAVAQGGTVVFDERDVLPVGSSTYVFLEPDLYIMKDDAADIAMQSTSNFPVQLCIGGQCEAAEKVTKPNLSFPANTKESLLLDATIIFGQGEEVVLPAIEVVVEAWYLDDPSTVYSMTLYMGDVAGISDAMANKTEISIAGRTLNYNLDSPAAISIFNLAGHAVERHNLAGSGSISLASLPAGLYLYRLEGRKGSTGKFVVR